MITGCYWYSCPVCLSCPSPFHFYHVERIHPAVHEMSCAHLTAGWILSTWIMVKMKRAWLYMCVYTVCTAVHTAVHVPRYILTCSCANLVLLPQCLLNLVPLGAICGTKFSALRCVHSSTHGCYSCVQLYIVHLGKIPRIAFSKVDKSKQPFYDFL